MKRLNPNRNFSSDESTWCFLAEFSLLEFLADHDRREAFTAGFIFQAVRELGMSPEWAENIEMALTESATVALAHSKQGEFLMPWRIRVFCQKKIIDNVSSAHFTSQPFFKDEALENAQEFLDSGAKINGGWGFFLIEREGGGSSTGFPSSSWRLVDLFLYKEGE